MVFSEMFVLLVVVGVVLSDVECWFVFLVICVLVDSCFVFYLDDLGF